MGSLCKLTCEVVQDVLNQVAETREILNGGNIGNMIRHLFGFGLFITNIIEGQIEGR